MIGSLYLSRKANDAHMSHYPLRQCPVVLISSAEEILARYEGTDYIGIVPHSETPKYCESMFPAKYGRVIDFTHVYEDEDEWFGQIEWIPEEESRLIK